MKNNTFRELKPFILLWSTQSLSSLGSAMTNFALVIWLYQETGSALTTSLLTVCSYAPYVVMSIFAGAISDRWNKKIIMLSSDLFAACCTIMVLILLRTGHLAAWHLYLLNALNGLMNTIQQPASDVSITLLTPQRHYQKTSGMRSFSNSLVTILTPVFATSMVAFVGVEAVIAFDLITFSAAFLVLLFCIRIPKADTAYPQGESFLQAARSGLQYLQTNKGILWLILFLAAINFVASVFEAALPAMILPQPKGGETVLGLVNSCAGIATLTGSVIISLLPAPKSRVRTICNTLLLSMSTENFFLAFSREPALWYIGSILGWIAIPIMNANMDVLFRTKIPAEMQGRVYSTRNSLQFFTIPLGYFLGGLLVDEVFEPLMAGVSADSFLVTLFGSGKGSGAAMLFFLLGIAGVIVCLIFRKVKHIWELEQTS